MTGLPPSYRKLLSSPPPIMLDRFYDGTYDFPRVVTRPSVYLIATTPRCGSHYFGHLLFATKQLGAPLEYLNPYSYRRWSQIVGSTEPAVILREIMARRTSPTGWFGLQAHWPQLTFAQSKLPHDALDFRRIIWVRRRDIIEQAVSLTIALQTGAWTSFHRPLSEPIYDYKAIADCADGIRQMESAWEQFLMRTNAPHLSLFYEDIRANESKAITDVLNWFELPAVDVSLSGALEKQATSINSAWKDRFLRDMRR